VIKWYQVHKALHAVIAFGWVIDIHGVQADCEVATHHRFFISYLATQKSCVVNGDNAGTNTYQVGQDIGATLQSLQVYQFIHS
jgi:hypothetical protein